MEDQDFLAFIDRIKLRTAIDLSQYKEAQMKRRLATLRNKHGYPSFAAYATALERSSELMDEFLDRMTINVSEFWRNPSRWTALEQLFVPNMLKERRELRIWSAACSTGEEPYTLAMIMDKQGALGRTSILATDLDNKVLARAREGRYAERAIRDVPPAYLANYFERQGSVFQVKAELQRAIQFKQHNLLHDSYGSGYDLIVCRNVLIYFTEEAKHVLFQRFAGALRPGGILFVGSTEQIFSPAQYGLSSVETFFYRRNE